MLLVVFTFSQQVDDGNILVSIRDIDLVETDVKPPLQLWREPLSGMWSLVEKA